MIQILIVDDFPTVRRGLRNLIEATDDLAVVGEAEDGEEAVVLAGTLDPDVVLMDLSLPGIDGSEATRRIVAQNPQATVLVLTAHSGHKRALEAIRAGARGYLRKDIAPALLLDAVRAAGRGESPIDARAARALVDTLVYDSATPALTNRESQILELVAAGLSNKQVAASLQMSEKTVKNHLTRIYNTLGVGGRTEAAMWAAQNGLFEAS